MILTPRSELIDRIERLQGELGHMGLDGALLHGTTSLFYFTGTVQQGHLWVPASGKPLLLVRRVLQRAQRESALDQILPLTSLRELAGHLSGARRIGMELDILSVLSFQTYERLLPGLVIEDIGLTTRWLRSVKSAWEVERIRAAARVADGTYREVQANLRPGMTELELAVVAEAAERRGGTQGQIRWRALTGFEIAPVGIVAGESGLAFTFTDTPFGGEGLTPAVPYGPGRRVIDPGMPICIDYATQVDGYINDQTRTLAVDGLDAELTHAYEVCQRILAVLEREVLPGVTGEQVWERSLAMAREAGLEAHYMGYGESRVRFVGHGVGLELDELPVLAPKQQRVLVAGNVIALEPKFFFPGKGAVGLENTYLVTPGGLERLSVSGQDLVVVKGSR